MVHHLVFPYPLKRRHNLARVFYRREGFDSSHVVAIFKNRRFRPSLGGARFQVLGEGVVQDGWGGVFKKEAIRVRNPAWHGRSLFSEINFGADVMHGILLLLFA